MREAIFDAIPYNLKKAVSVGIGLFIAFIGLQNAKVVIGGSTLLSLFSLDGYNKNLAAAAGGKDFVAASMNDVGITVLLAIIGIIITGIMVVKNVKGNILWGILITWVFQCRNQHSKSFSDLCKIQFRRRADSGICCDRICILVCRFV